MIVRKKKKILCNNINISIEVSGNNPDAEGRREANECGDTEGG